MAFDQATRKLYALVNTVTGDGDSFATMYCLDATSDAYAACPSEDGAWDSGVPIGISGSNAVGTGLAITQTNRVVYSWWSPDGMETRIGQILPSGDQDTGFGEYRDIYIYETTLQQDDGVGDCVRRAHVSKILPGPGGSIYIVGYLAAQQEVCIHGSDRPGKLRPHAHDIQAGPARGLLDRFRMERALRFRRGHLLGRHDAVQRRYPGEEIHDGLGGFSRRSHERESLSENHRRQQPGMRLIWANARWVKTRSRSSPRPLRPRA